MGFLHAALLLLLFPVALVFWKTRTEDHVTDALRAACGLLLVLALAGPYLARSSSGRDLVIVADRSLSMPADSRDSLLELVRLAEDERGTGDRVAVIAFGGEAAIERIPAEEDRFQDFGRDVPRGASDVGGALDAALHLIPEGRRGSILLLSDGENNGADPVSVARRAFARGVRIDVREYARPGVADLSVERLELPGEVAVGEPFQFNVWVHSDRRVESDFALRRGEKVLSSGRRVFEKGLNRLVFRDVLGAPGISEYDVQLATEDDRIPENNRGLGAVDARGAPAVLVLSEAGGEDTLVRALLQARIPVVASTPERARIDNVGLSPFRAVIIENVAAQRLDRDELHALTSYVVDQGGGLMLTGGQASFGIGGYYLSPLESVLPVTMELRQEHRKLAVAMAITMDRSGSMGAPAGSGMTKMDLANRGASEAIRLLSPMDAIAVIAVDSAAHVVQPLTPVSGIDALVARVESIGAGGGGIFVHTALVAAVRQLEDAKQINKHIILFADAADSEEQGGCIELVTELNRSGVTTSVIALGTDTDVDAAFLEQVAASGGGEVYFTTDPDELPSLFALDTMTAARSTFVDQKTPVAVLPDLFGLGVLPAETFPEIGGYNLAYMRPDAQAGMVTEDEYKAPIFAFMHQGLGRTAAYTGQIGGTYGSEVVAWAGFSGFFETATRWLLGNEEPEEFFPSVTREGNFAVLSVEVDPEEPIPPDTSMLTARIVGADGERTELELARTGEFLFEARYPLEKEGVALGTVVLGPERFVRLPPIALPYSPEFERSPDKDRGRRTLREIARESGGEVGPSATALFRGSRQGRLWRVVSRELMVAALVLWLLEIAGRRLSLWGSLRTPAFARRLGARARAMLGRIGAKVPRRRPKPRRKTSWVEPADEPAPARAEEAAAPAPGATPAAPSARERPQESLGSALSRARRAADKKLER